MHINVSRLKGKIIENNTTQEAIADIIGVNRSTFYRKMKASGLTFSIEEVQRIIAAIPLTKQEAVDIFLAE